MIGETSETPNCYISLFKMFCAYYPELCQCNCEKIVEESVNISFDRKSMCALCLRDKRFAASPLLMLLHSVCQFVGY